MAKDKVKKRNTANRLLRSDKLAKRLKNIDAKSGFKSKSALFTVRVIARQAVEIGGYLIAVNSDNVMLRHKRTNASKRTVVSRFANTDLVEVYGAVGEVSSVTVIRDVTVREVTGRIVEDKGGVITLQTDSGETVKVFQHGDVRIEVSAEDEQSEGGSKKAKKSKSKDKGEKAGKKTKKKKSKSDDDDDDLDD